MKHKKIFLLLIMLLQFVVAPGVFSVGIDGDCSAGQNCDSGLMCNSSTGKCIVSMDISGAKIQKSEGIMFVPSVSIPGFNVPDGGIEIKGDFAVLTNYVSKFYKFAIGFAGILSVIMLTIAGLMWLTAGGNSSQIGKAKQWIGGSLTGLVLTLLSYTILYTINPDIVALKLPPAVSNIDKIAEECGWQKKVCNPNTQKVSANDSDCGQKPQIFGKDDPDQYCCCKN